jgi:hypothetical protein
LSRTPSNRSGGQHRVTIKCLPLALKTAAERDLASDMILKAPKPAARRPSSYDIFTRNLAFDLVEDRMAAGDLMDVAVKAAEEQFKLSASTIYEIYDKFFAARDGREAPRRRRLKK